MGLGRLFLLATLILFSVHTYATPYCPDANYWRPDLPSENVANLTETDVNQGLDYDNLKLLVWNVAKSSAIGAYSDLNSLTQTVDLALIQEGYLSKAFQNLLCSRDDMNWKMAKSFKDSSGIYTGVMTASFQNPDEFFALRSPNTEPVTNTPKMVMVTKYSIPDSTKLLMVVNIHGINFVSLAHYKNQIDLVVKTIKEHKGPVIFAGDFNTHLEERMAYLEKVLPPLGLDHAKITGNEFKEVFVLDHLFTRGFEVTKAETLKHVQTSDHKPLYFELRLLK